MKWEFLARLVRVAAVVGAVGGILTSSPASAEEEVSLPGEAIVVHAVSLERVIEERIIIGDGAVDIRHGGLRLRADHVVLHEDTKDIIADGNVILDDGRDRLQGEHLEFNLETKVGFIENGQGFAQSYYFTGELIEKRGEDRYRVRRGSFTTCEGTLPDWKFRSPDTSIHVNHYLTTRHPSMWVRRVPVFYLPYAVFPVKEDRATGFLVPEIRLSKIEGWILKNAFFWAPRDNFDATVNLDYYQNMGWGRGLEVRYILDPGAHGQLNGFYIKNRDTKAERWKLTYNHRHNFPYDVIGQAEVDMQSDRLFERRFADDLEKRGLEKTNSSFFLSRSWTSYDLVFSGQHQESLITEEKTSITRFPEITLDRINNRFFGTDLFWRLSVEGAKLLSKEEGGELRTTRLDVVPEVSWPRSLGSWGSLTPSLSYHETYYSRGLDGRSLSRGVPVYQLSLEGPRLYRIYNAGGGPGRVEKYKHLIEPRLGYQYVPEVDQENIPQFDSLDYLPPDNSFHYSLTNTLLGKVSPEEGEEGERPRTKELLRVKLSQRYDFNPEDDEEGNRHFSPLEWEACTRPRSELDLKWKGNYNFTEGEIGYQNLSLTWDPGTRATLRGEWRTSKEGSQDFLDLWAKFFLGDWGLEGRSRYQLQEKNFIENRAGVKYTSQCWEVTVNYIRWPEEYEFRLQVSLKEIGTILRF